MSIQHPVPSGPDRRMAEAEARVGTLADAGRDVLSAAYDVRDHVKNCSACQTGARCAELEVLHMDHEAVLKRLRQALRRLTGVWEECDGRFTLSHDGEQLTGVCDRCLAVIAGQALRQLPEAMQRVVIASAPVGRRLIQAAKHVAGPAVTGGTIPAEAMDDLTGAVALFHTGRRLHEDTLARDIRGA